MFTSDKFYIIVGKSSFIIKKKGQTSETTIDFKQQIPNVPFYYHLFDMDKTYIQEITDLVKRFKIKNATIIFPDDTISLETDKRILIEFFMQCGVKKLQQNFQCFLLSLDSRKYISVSRTTRTLVIQYIANNRSLSTRYYDKEYRDMEQISLDIRNLHTDCSYESMPVYINNVNSDMEEFNAIGSLVSLDEITSNMVKE